MVMTVAMPACGALTPCCFVRDKSLLSSKSALASSPLLSSAPPAFSSHVPSSRIVQARSQAEERNSTGALMKQLVVGVMAAGVVLAAGTDVGIAASGPGTKGAERTSQKATDLLKSADKLTKEEAPKRFGPGQFPSSVEDAASSAQKAGGGAIEGFQSSSTKAIDSAKKNVESTKSRIDGIFGKTQGKAAGVSDLAAGKASETKENEGIGGVSNLAAGKASETKENAQRILNQSSDSGISSKGLLGSIQEGFQNLKDNAVQKGEDTLNAAEEVKT